MNRTVQIAIVGPSGSGKTWLAQRIIAALHPNAVHIRLDDFYRGLPPDKPELVENTNFDDPNAIDWESVRGVFERMASRELAMAPIYDFATHTRTGARPVTPNDFVIWDGLWLLHEPWLRERFDLAVFVDCTSNERFARRLARDMAERGRTAESVRRQFEQHVEPMRERFVEPQRRWARYHLSLPCDEAAVVSLLREIRAAAGAMGGKSLSTEGTAE